MKTNYEKEYQNLTISDNFLFCKVMSDKTLCKMFLEAVLKIKINHLQEPVTERFTAIAPDRKSVRFDVFAEDDNFLFDIEMQVTRQHDLALRSRYYQAINDVEHLPSGDKYNMLKANVVIFLCDFDPFKLGLPCYTFVNTCKEDQTLELGDNTMKIFYNFNMYAKIADEHVRGTMEYMAIHSTSEYISQYMDELVKQSKNMPTWSKEYQCTLEFLEEAAEKGRAEAEAEYKALLAEKDELIAKLQAELTASQK